ncbi:MAG: hypothetical protein AB8G18_17325 [Gammaproteobacteria bacterium]
MSSNEFKLPKGVSGFSNKDQNHDVSFARFKSACVEAGRRAGGWASKYVQAGVTPNFHQATIKYDGKSLHVVCNPEFGFIAFAEATNSASLEFFDDADFTKSFKLQGYKVIQSAVLSEKLDDNNCSELHETELEQVKYWRSKVVGDVIFNWYD